MVVVRLFLRLIILGLLASPVLAWFGLEDAPLVVESVVRDVQWAKLFYNTIPERPMAKSRQLLPTKVRSTALATAQPAVPQLKAQIVPSHSDFGCHNRRSPATRQPVRKVYQYQHDDEPTTTGLRSDILVSVRSRSDCHRQASVYPCHGSS